MIIELRGVDFVNKGGELMLHAIVSRIKKQIPGTLLVMQLSKASPRKKLLEYGIYSKTTFSKYKIRFEYIFSLIPSFLRRKWHYVQESEIDVILDASGFAYGDYWGAQKAAKRLGNGVGKWKKDGKKIVLMPQAFGPFSEPELIKVMKKIISHSDLVFARDEVSFSHLEKLTGIDNDNVMLSPDFTNLLAGKVPPYFKPSEMQVAIIVNSKMIETTGPEKRFEYEKFLVRIVEMVEKRGFMPYFLIHETHADLDVARNINNRLQSALVIVEEDDPLAVKGMIGNSVAVVTSRFHGLASSLSQAVPCLTTGWSHKYEMLLNDYDYAEGLLTLDSADSILQEKVDLILEEASRNRIVQKLAEHNLTQKHRSEKMWETVFSKIGRGVLTKTSLPPVASICLINLFLDFIYA